jgi:DNA-binding transcriptional ArsR family regulator
MARAATTTDVFNAVAESTRRDILLVLATGESSVGDLVARLHLSQPQVSKHLGVLRTVDLVRARTAGRQRLYRVNGPALKPIHDWVATFEQHWNDRLDRLDDLLLELRHDVHDHDVHDQPDPTPTEPSVDPTKDRA